MEPPEQQHQQPPQPLFIKLLSVQSDIIADCLLSLTSPFLSLLSILTTSLRREETKETLDCDTDTDTPPSAATKVLQGSSVLLRKAVLGFVGAAYVCLVLTTVMVVSVVVGVALVHLWVEEPVHIKENLYFDYTDANPYAILDFGLTELDKVSKSVPVGHLCRVRLVFVMPESEYNREIGMFQVTAEALSVNGDIIARASHPYMLRFRSLPIRLMRTFLMGVPLLLGMTSEIQTINMPLLKYKEHYYPRTQSIKLSFAPRAGTRFLPQVYEARVIVSSQLPWRKELVRKWKWTFYVWTSIYVYLALVVALFYYFRSKMFPAVTTDQSVVVLDVPEEEVPRVDVGAKDRPTSETLKRWRQSQSKRKAMLLGEEFPETNVWSEATSMSVTRDEDTSMTTEEVGDSESLWE